MIGAKVYEIPNSQSYKQWRKKKQFLKLNVNTSSNKGKKFNTKWVNESMQWIQFVVLKVMYTTEPVGM